MTYDAHQASAARGLGLVVPEGLDRRIRDAAERERLSTSAWVRRTIERALADDRPSQDVLDRLACIEALTGDIERMLREIEAGRGS